MRRVILFLILAALVVALAWWVAGLPGAATLQLGATTIQASVPVVVLLAVVLFLVLYSVLRLLALLVSLPRRLRAARATRARRQGEAAITRTLVALAAGEAGDARREANRARRLLGDTPQTLLLAAEAARRAGREDEAAAAFRLLAERQDAAFLGWSGLLRQAIAREEWADAAALAARAEEAHPGSVELRRERIELALRAHDWKGALALGAAEGPRAALETAAAEAEGDPVEARRLAKQAFEADPGLPPAALAYARRLRETGREGKAQDVIRRAWDANPHPDLAAFALAPIEARLERAQAAERLVRGNREHPESHLLLARTALEAGLLGEARRHAEAARSAGVNQRRVWTLLADVAEAEGNAEAGREALRHAAMADPDPVWRCEACGTTQPNWHAVCPACHAAGRMFWTRWPLVPALT
ncbi:MAG TPA: heme biosynthesis HemY N-terminal domain-containing protein [Acetobacteraceae bacterium]|nr:heme biosynthesis HemY N-terminal domain-containing protein [Acetobacteraceae bacterium]